MDVERDDLTQFPNKPRIPERVVVNNQTLSVFETFNYEHMTVTIPLKTLKILPHETERDCIILKDNGRKDFH
jgi:hypothetical protein